MHLPHNGISLVYKLLKNHTPRKEVTTLIFFLKPKVFTLVLFPILPNCVKTPFMITSFLSFKFIVRVVWILVATFLGMSWFIALILDHIYPPSFANLLLLGCWFQQFLVFISVSHTFFTSDCNFLVFKQCVPLHPCCGYLVIWLILFRKKVVNKLLFTLMLKVIC